MKKHTYAICLLTLTALLSWGAVAQAAPGKKPQAQRGKRSAKAPKAPRARRHANETRETIILPVRYTRGSRMVRLLKMFVPFNAHHRVMLRYSPSLHKILIRAPRPILDRLIKASKKLDVPQAQFRVQIYFLKPIAKDQGKVLKQFHPGLHKYMKQTYHHAPGYVLASSTYIQVSNHAEAQFKVTERDRTGAPAMKLVLHQAPNPKALIALRLKLAQYESFKATSAKGTNTQFISSVLLQTRLFVKPGQYTLAGHAPFHGRDTKYNRALVVVKIDRITR